MANSYEQLKYLRDMLKRKAESSKYDSFVNPNDVDYSGLMADDISQEAEIKTNMYSNPTQAPTTEVEPETPEETINWWKRTVDTIGAVDTNITRGLFNFFDSVGDLFFNIADAIGGGDVEWAQNARDFDWVSYATNVTGISRSLINGDMYNGNYFDSFASQEDAQSYINQTVNESNFLSEAEGVNEFMTGVEESIGFMLPSIAVGIATGGAATAAFGAVEGANAAAVAASAANVAKIAALGTMGVGSFASSYNEVYKETGDVAKSMAVGALSAGVEIGTELLFPEGKVMGVIGGKEVTATFGQFAKAMGHEFIEEGTEEVLSALAQPFIDEIYKDGSIKNAYVDDPAQFFLGIGGNFNESVLGQGLAGGVSGIAMGGVSQAQINAEVDKLVGKEGRKLLAKGQELGEVANDYFADVKKGKLTEEQLKEKYSDLFGEKGSEWLKEWSKLNGKLTTEQKKNFARLIANPAEVIRQQIQDTDEDYSKFVERTIKGRSDISNVEATGLTEYINKAFNTDLKVDFLNEDLIKNRTELEKYLGYNLNDKQYNQLLTNGEAFNENGNVIVLNEKYKDQYNKLIAHEALSHGILDSNEELRNKLLSDLSNNQDFYNAWKEYFKSAKNVDTIAELYGLQGLAAQNISKEEFKRKIETLNSEQMASFVEFIMSNTNLIKTLDNVSSNKLQTIIRRALNKLKASKNNSLTKATNLLENTLKAIKNNNNNTNANRQQMAYSIEKIEGDKYGYSNEFRRIQEESRKLSIRELEQFHSGRKTIDGRIRQRLSTVFEREIGNWSSRFGYGHTSFINSADKTKNVVLVENVDGKLFHDVFEIIRQYLPAGDAVTLHVVDDYSNTNNFLSNDGMQGFSITNDGDLISVFSLKKGFLPTVGKAIVEKYGAKTLDCYETKLKRLPDIYQKYLGFKPASILDFNKQILVDEFGLRYANYFVNTYGESPVYFMVSTDKEVEAKHFNKNQYDEALEYRNSFMNDSGSKNNKETKPNIKFSLSTTDSQGNQLSKEQQEFFKDSKVRDEKGNLLVVYHGTKYAGFTVFEHESNSNGFYRFGGNNVNFFTDDLAMANSYSSNYDGKPKTIDFNKRAKSFNQIQRVLEEYCLKNGYQKDFITITQGKNVPARFGYTLEDNKYYLFADNYLTLLDSYKNIEEFYSENGIDLITNSYGDFDDNPLDNIRDDGSIYKSYLNIEKPFTIDAYGNFWNSIPDNKIITKLKNSFVALKDFLSQYSELNGNPPTKKLRYSDTEIDDFIKTINSFNYKASWVHKGEDRKTIRLVDMLHNEAEASYDTSNYFSRKTYSFVNVDGYVSPYSITKLLDGAIDIYETSSLEATTKTLTTNDIVVDAINSGKYDGVIIKNVIDYGSLQYTKALPKNLYITLKGSDQIKDINNKKPTSNPDIRFSLNNSPIEYKFDKEKVQEYNYDNFEEVKKFVHFDDWSEYFRGIEEIKKIFNGEISVVNSNKNLEQLVEFYLNAKYNGRGIGNDGVIPTAILPPELLLLKKQIEQEDALTYFRIGVEDGKIGSHQSTLGNKFDGKIMLDIEKIVLSNDTIFEVLRHERMHHYRDNLRGIVEKKFTEPLFDLLKSKHSGERTLYNILKNYLSNLYKDHYYKQALNIIGNETVLGKERIATMLMKTFSINEFTKYLNQDKETLAKEYSDFLIDEEILTFAYSQTKLFDDFFKKENILEEVSEIRNNFREEMKKQYNTPEILFSLSGNNNKADTVRESRYYANSYSTNVISYTNAQQIFTNIVNFLNNHFNILIDTTNVNNIARELTIDFNTISSKDDLLKLKNKMKIMSMIILDVNLKETVVGKDGKEKIVINENMTLRDAIKSAGMSDTWFEDFLGEQLYKAFEKKSDKSRINKVVTEYIDRLNEALLEIKNRKLITYYTIKTQKSMLGLKDKFNKHTFSGTNRKAVDSPLLKFYKEILNNSLKVTIATKSKLGISPKFVNQLLLDLESYNAEALKEKYDWIELEEDLEGNSLVEQYRDALIDSLSTKANPNLELTYEEMEATYNLVGTLSKELSNLIKDEGANRRKQVRKADLELRSLEKAYSDGKNFLDTNVIQRELNKASSPDTTIKNYFGSNSDVYKIVFNDVFNSTSNQLLKQQEFIDQFNELKEKFGITDKVLNKKVEVTFNGKTFNIATKVLLDIYTMTLTEATYKTITNGGYRFNDGKTNFKIALNETDIPKLNDYLGDNLRSFAEEVLLDLYNGTARDYKSERDAHIKGYKVLLFNDLFYPSNKADSKVSSLEQNDYGVINFENTSINKERKKAYHMPLLGMGFEERLFSYINALTKYGEMSDSLKTLNTFLNGFTKDSELDKPIKRRSLFGNVTNELRTIFDYLYERIGGKNDYIKSGSKFFSNIIQATLYGNPSVVLKQTASLPTVLNEVRTSSFFKAFKDIPYNVKNYKAIKQELMKNSGFLADRWNNNEIIRAEALTNYLNKFSKIFGVPMEKMDEAVIIAFGYGAAIEESKITGEDPIKILERIVANTQSNAITLKVSMARSGAAGYLRKFLSYFTSDLQNKVSLINNLINEKRIAKKAIVGVESMIESTQAEIKELEELGNEFNAEDMATEEYQEYLDKLEEKKDKLANLEAIKADKQAIIDTDNVAKGSKLILSLTMSALIIASITELVKRLLGKKDWKWDDETTKEFAITLALESTINNLPYVNTILNSIEYNNKITGLDISILNQFITILNDLYNQIQGNGDWVSTLKDVALTLGNMTGLPISNLYKYGVGIYKNISPNGYKVDAIVQSYSPTYILKEYKDAINKGMNKKASGYLELVMSSRTESSDEVRKEINSLYKDGYNTLPKPYLTSYTNEKGEAASLTKEQINAFKTEYNKANAQVEKLMQLTDYKTKTSEEKSKLIKKIYDTYYSYAKAKTLNLNKADNKLSTLLLYSNGRINVSKFVNILGKIGSITESKNKTRKELVFAYVNRLGLNTNEKLLLLYLAGYSSKDNNEKLARYLRNLGLSSKKANTFLGVE